MKVSKIFSIIFLVSMFVSMFAILAPVSAYSTEVTALETYGFDNNQQTYVKIGTVNLFVFGNTLNRYDNYGNLTGFLRLPELTKNGAVQSATIHVNATRIYPLNSTHILLGFIAFSQTSFNPYYVYADYEYGLININTLGYTKLYGSCLQLMNTYTVDTSDSFANCAFMVNTNTTGTFYYFYVSVAGQDANDNKYTGADIIQYVGKYISGTYTFAQSLKYSKTYSAVTPDQNYLRSNTIILDNTIYPQIPINYVWIITSNNWWDGNRANIYQYNIASSTVTFIGVTSLDLTYTGYSSSVNSAGFVYLIGVGAYSDKINVNLVYSTYNSGTQLWFETLTFNATSITQSGINIGVATNSLIARPFTVGWTTGTGNTSALYSMGYFDDVYGTWALTGISASLTGIETNTPTWAFYQTQFLFTPQQPQSYPYYVTSNSWGGFQPVGTTLGIFVDLQNGKAKANYMYGNSNTNTFVVTLVGDIFNGGSIATAPTEITLKQGTGYTLTGHIYLNNVLSGTGNFSVLTSSYSSSNGIFTLYDFTNKVDGTVVNGEFTISLSTVTAITTVYRVMRINYTLTDGSMNYNTYNFGYYALGGSGSGGTVPYPTPIGGGGSGVIIGGGGSGTSGNSTTTISTVTAIFTNWQNIAVIIIYAVLCGLCTYYFGFTGLIAGFNIATILCLIIGVLGVLMYPVIGLMAIADIALIISGSGFLSKTRGNTN